MGDAASASGSVESITSTISSTTIFYTNNHSKTVATSTLPLTTPLGPSLTTFISTVPAPSTPAVPVTTSTSPLAGGSAPTSSISTSSTSTSVVPISASTASPTSTPTKSGQPGSPGLGGGAIAGTAVGCLIGGALIAGFLAWLIMSRRQKKRSSGYGGGFGSERHRSSRASNEKALPAAPLLGGVAAGNWEKHLDQPESDNTISRSVKGLFDHTEVHVENFYRDAQVTITPELQNALMTVEGSRDLPDSVAGLLPLAERPTMLIKHCIAHSIVQHINAESDIPDSFLPTDFVALPQLLTTRRTTANKAAYNQAYSRWRVLSAYLRPKPAEDPTYTRTRDANIAALADKLCRVFDPWALSRDNFASRRENLVNIMKGGSETGMLLFSQPSSFRWRWGSESAGAGKGGRVRVVLLPGLVKVRDEEARELERGVEILKPVVGVLVG